MNKCRLIVAASFRYNFAIRCLKSTASKYIYMFQKYLVCQYSLEIWLLEVKNVQNNNILCIFSVRESSKPMYREKSLAGLVMNEGVWTKRRNSKWWQ